MGDAWDSFLTGLTGGLSMVTGGLVPIYGEPDDFDPIDRLKTTGKAGVKSVEDIVEDPSIVLQKDGEVFTAGVDRIGSSILAGLGWQAWLVIGAAVYFGVVRK